MGGDLLDRPDQAGDLVATGVEAGVDQVAASSEGLEAEAILLVLWLFHRQSSKHFEEQPHGTARQH